MDKRNALRAGAVSATATLMMLLSSPVFAATQDATTPQAGGLSVGASIGLYVVTPIVLFAIIAGLVMLGSANAAKGKGKKK
ncbi:hypothetical protein [Kitasatospora sp. NBC_01287]|uniref:hypothetical protein n=1 Tax=Kitasatospora sp. NBC_01287 TaxID=2903573 RepID=UPI002B1E6280|nr:hypothetical protein [Kitasatospora sp. NBC_01287]